MAVENANFIHQLDPNNPPSTDRVREGNLHLQMIKRALRQTFPEITGVTQVTQAQLEALVGIEGNIEERLQSKLEEASLEGFARYATNGVFTRTQAIEPIDLGDVSGVVSPNCAHSTCFVMRAVGSITLSPTNFGEGQEVVLKIVQGPGAPYSVSFSSVFHWPFRQGPNTSVNAGEYDVIAAKTIDGVLVSSLLGNLGVAS